MPESTMQPAIDLGRLAPGLGDCCGGYLESYRRDLEQAIRAGRGGVQVSRHYARSLDGLLGALACACKAACTRGGSPPAGRVALVAVGGYGRGLVALHSDVDVLFLCDDPEDPQVAALAHGLLYPLWDLGLNIGHAVRGVDETLRLARQDIRTATTLLDLRWVAGDASIVEELGRAARRQVFEPALEEFLSMLLQDSEARHERYGASLFLLEPEVKLGRGGLRDLDVAVWAGGARWGCRTIRDFVRNGALLSREGEELERAREMMWRVRNLLHLRGGRCQDRLTFADQEDVAEELGFVDGAALAVEQFMQAYYRNARIAAQTAERMIARACPTTLRRQAVVEDLGGGILSFDRQITFVDSKALEETPALALRLYQKVVEAGQPPYPFARDVIARKSVDPSWRQRLRRSEEAASLFMSALSFTGVAPLRRGSVIGELHEVGLLLAMLPELEPLFGHVEHDVYHVYTTDVHAVFAVDFLRELVRGDHKRRLPLACRLAAEAPRKIPLFLAVFLHDVGKVHGRGRARRGALTARAIAERLGLSPMDVEHVVWLVVQHLSLYHQATRRDTSDPETLTSIAREMGTPERLRDLYLLTVAAVSSTNPTAMSSWKARMLEDLYLAVAGALDGDAERPTSTRVRAIRKAVSVGFVGDAGNSALEDFLRDMPERYVLATPVDAIRVHARAARDRGERLVHVARASGPSDDVAELLVFTDDRPGLLADLAAVLAANRLTVVAAQIHTRPLAGRPDEAFDIFHVRRQEGADEPLDNAQQSAVARDIHALLHGDVDAAGLMRRVRPAPAWARRRTPDVDTEVVVDNAASRRFTVVDVFSRDRIGLLHVIARTLHRAGLSIALSKVGTEGDRATDVFYVQLPGGGKLLDAERLGALPGVIEDAVAGYSRELDAGSVGEGGCAP